MANNDELSALSRSVERLLVLAEENLMYTRLLAVPAVREVLEKELPTDMDKRVYQASRNRSIRAIGAETGSSFGYVQSRWKRWKERGIMVSSSDYEGRSERAFDLEAMGLLNGSVGVDADKESAN